MLALKSPLGPVDTCPSILLIKGCLLQVPDPHLEIRGGAVIQTLRLAGGAVSQKNYFFGPSGLSLV